MRRAAGVREGKLDWSPKAKLWTLALKVLLILVGAEQRGAVVIGVDVRNKEEEEDEVRSRLVEGHLDISKARCDSRRLLLSRQVDQCGLDSRLEDGMTRAVREGKRLTA